MHYTWIFLEEVEYDELYLLFSLVCHDNFDGVPHQEQEHVQLFDFQKLHEKLGKVKKFQGDSSTLSASTRRLK